MTESLQRMRSGRSYMTEEKNKPKQFVLIVDDVEANRFTLRDIILEMGLSPVLTENGPQALKFAEKHLPQLIILDIAMPEMDGYEVCQKLKENVNTREIPIVFISAYDDAKDVVKGFELGGSDYITKPFIREIVKARVGLHLKLTETRLEMKDVNRQLQSSVKQQLQQMEIEKRNVLYALTRVARENAGYDAQHMERMKRNSKLLAEAMQLSDRFSDIISDAYIQTLELAAPLCDLGNVSIPTHILQKQEALTEQEWDIMKTHTTVGARILDDVRNTGDYNDFLQISWEIAMNHHENWDGTGYPNHIKEEEIPLSAQIVSVASAFCALTEKRMYRNAYSAEDAIIEMEKEAGKKYNPEIFKIIKMIQRRLE